MMGACRWLSNPLQRAAGFSYLHSVMVESCVQLRGYGERDCNSANGEENDVYSSALRIGFGGNARRHLHDRQYRISATENGSDTWHRDARRRLSALRRGVRGNHQRDGPVVVG